MPTGFYRDFIKEILAIGFVYEGPGKGSHEKWYNSASQVRLIVPRHLFSRHMANALLKQAGSTKKF